MKTLETEFRKDRIYGKIKSGAVVSKWSQRFGEIFK
jgi:hypothetical protein